MLARLNAAQPLLAALLAEPTPTINITGVDPKSNLVWLGAKYVICFNIPPSVNSNPKNLVLYISDGSSGTYYPNSLGDASLPMPAGPQGCANMSVSRGVVIGPYTISMEDTYGRAFTTVSFFGDKATITEASFTLAGSSAGVGIHWAFSPGRATVNDTVWVLDSRGTLAYWFYTSCACTTKPGPAPAQNGTYTLKIYKPAVSGGYSFELHPGGGKLASMVATNWIPWAKIGW